MTVRADGRHRKQPVEPVSDKCAWDLTKPLPEGWAVGTRDAKTQHVHPVKWFDPYHQAEMYQVRSDHRWYKGFARLLPNSIVRVKIWVDKPGPSQVVACVRKDDLGQSDTAVLEWNGAFATARPREWQVFQTTAQAMRDDKGNKHAPKFGDPWVAFLIIFNTYERTWVVHCLVRGDSTLTAPPRPKPFSIA